MKEVIEKIEQNKEAMDKKFAEAEIAVKKMMEDNAALQLRVTEMEKIAAERRAAFSLPGVTEQKDQFSFLKAIYAIKSGDWKNAGFEHEVFTEVEKKAMSAGADTAGGYIVPSDYIPELIELLRANMVAMSLGATVLGGLTSSPIEIPKQTGGATAYWVEENAAITESALTVGQIKLTPKAVAAMVKLSNRLIRMSNPSAEAMVRRDIAQTLGLAIDLAILRGSGASSQPLGIVNTSDINMVYAGTAGVSGGTPNFDTLLDMAYEVELDNALRGKLGFVFHPAIKRLLTQLKVAQYSGDTSGMYIVSPVSDAELTNWIQYPFKTTTQLPIDGTVGSDTNCTEIIFGNWQELIIGQWAGMEIMASQETSDAFEKNQTWVRIIQEVDVAVRHPQSFCLCNDAKIA